jgi:hypothetical protein
VTTPESFAAELEPTVEAVGKKIVTDAIQNLPFPKRLAAKAGSFLLWMVLADLIQAIVEIIIQRWTKRLSGVVMMMKSQNSVSGHYNPAVDELGDLLSTKPGDFHPAVREAMGIGGSIGGRIGASNGE